MEVKIEASWKSKLKDEFDKEYFVQLTDFVRDEYQKYRAYPPAKFIFSAFDHCPFDEVNVVVIGQDPYHGAGQAHGLCFSVNDGMPKPPSLVNIFKEIEQDLSIPIPSSGSLVRLADQGVLLLNATLTVQAHKAGSHQNQGWEEFTDAVIKTISDGKENVVFLCWGAFAQRKAEIIDRSKTSHSGVAAPLPFFSQ